MEEKSRSVRKKGRTAAEQDYFGLLTITDEQVIEIIESHPYVIARLGE